MFIFTPRLLIFQYMQEDLAANRSNFNRITAIRINLEKKVKICYS